MINISKYKSPLIYLITLIIIIFSSLYLRGAVREDVFNVLMFILPLLGFIVGIFISINYANKIIKSSLTLISFGFLSIIFSNLFWYIDFKGISTEFMTHISDIIAIFGALIFLYAIVTTYKMEQRNIPITRMLPLYIASAIATYVIFLYISDAVMYEEAYFNVLFIPLMIICVYLLIPKIRDANKEKEFNFWCWIFLFFALLALGELAYTIRLLQGEYYIGDIADALITFSYAAVIPAFMTYANKTASMLHHVEEKYNALFTHSGAPTFIMDEENRIIISNPRFNELIGDEKSGKNSLRFQDLVEAKDRSSICGMIDEIKKRNIEDSITKDIRIHSIRGDMLYCSVTFSYVMPTGITVVTLFDITDRKKLELELKKMNEDLQNFTFTVSHDLKEPLRNISSLATYLKRDYSDNFDEMGMEFLNTLVSSVSTMSKLVDDLLTLSRVGRKNVDFTFVDINELIGEVLQDISKTIEEKNAVIEYKDLPKALVQKTWIKQVFQNLITNALKFNESETPQVKIEVTPLDFAFEFTVTDNGIGISKEYHEKIFKLFEQLQPREQYGGTGAGLAIVKKIIEEHKGEIWVESEVDKGTSFHFTIEKFFIGESP